MVNPNDQHWRILADQISRQRNAALDQLAEANVNIAILQEEIARLRDSAKTNEASEVG